MAQDLDQFPTDDPILDSDGKSVSNVWSISFNTLVQTLGDYLTQYGILVPRLTTDERDSIQEPIGGQLIYNTDTDQFQGYQDSAVPGWVNL